MSFTRKWYFMKIFYVTVHYCVEFSFSEYDVDYFFNSEESMNNWIERFYKNKNSLESITSCGEAYFNKIGMLVTP